MKKIPALAMQYHKVLLVAEWLFMQLLMWRFHGVKTISDSWKYLGESILDPASMPGKEKLYMVYVGFLDVFQWLGANLEAMVLVQVLISGFATIFLYKTLRRINTSVLPAMIGTGFYILFYPVQMWNYFILTESLYISLTIIVLYLLVVYGWRYALPAVMVLVFVRPSGIVFITAMGLALLFSACRSSSGRLTRKIVLPVLLLFVLVAVDIVLRDFRIVDTWSTGRIVYNVHNYTDPAIVDRLTLDNASFVSCDDHGLQSSLLEMVCAVIRNPVFTGRLFLHKTLYFSLDIRPYYSTLHNIFSIGVLLVLYTGVYLYVQKGSHDTLMVFVSTYLLGTVLMAGLTILSWEGRFFAPLYPVLVIFGCTGWARLLSNVSGRAG